MSKMTKEQFVEKMLAYEKFKRAEKRRKLIWERKRDLYDYIDFSSTAKFREYKRKK